MASMAPLPARIAVVLAGCAVTAACAGRPAAVVEPRRPSPAVEVDTLIRRGCFRCLEEAFAASVQGGLTERVFESALLLAARSKELGLPHARWIDAARGALPSVPGWDTYISIVLSIPADPFSGDRDALLAENASTRRQRPVLEQWRRELMAGPGSALFRAYLDLTLACGPLLFEQREAAAVAALRAHSDAALIHYRVGICGDPARLQAMLQADPEFADAEFELGRAALQRERADQDEALRRFSAARSAFPVSPMIAAAIGTLRHEREEWEAALEAYDATLALVPTHRDALLGRTISLSHLDRHAEAIASATSLIDLGNWFIADAHYWRAWNAFHLNDVASARTDIDRAKRLSATPPTLVLSGTIAWREKQAAVAEAEFEAALAADFGYCEAALYLGEVRVGGRRWEESLAALQHAAQCFDLSIETSRKAIAQLGATDDDARANARQIASHERTMMEAEKRRAVALERTASIRRVAESTR
jgi:tetratricopeptide (TPR) repeat protein